MHVYIQYFFNFITCSNYFFAYTCNNNITQKKLFLNNISKKNPEYYKKNKRICEVIDILRYEDDGTLLKKFIKSDIFLIKYLGFDYKHDEHDSSDDSESESDRRLKCPGFLQNICF